MRHPVWIKNKKRAKIHIQNVNWKELALRPLASTENAAPWQEIS